MLDGLIKELNKVDAEYLDNQLFIESIAFANNLKDIEKFSLINESTEPKKIYPIRNALTKVNIRSTDIPTEMKMTELYNYVNKTITEGSNITVKRLAISKANYDIIKLSINLLKTSKDPSIIKDSKKRIKKFLIDVKSQIRKMDDEHPVDSFIDASIESLLFLYTGSKTIINEENMTAKEAINQKIRIIIKYL